MTTPLVHFITLGCAKNEVDTRDMQQRLASCGFGIAGDIDEADAVVVNTCSFIQPAVEESIDTILDVLDCAHVSDCGIPVIVSGCMPSRYGKDLDEEFPEAAAFIPCSKEDDIVQVVSSCLNIGPLGESAAMSEFDIPDPLPLGSGTFAYVKISDGCDRFCSYCTIPYIRGRYHSFPLGQIIEECRRLVDAGARELVLIGQDTGLWGSDFDKPLGLSDLLEALAEEFPDTWIRTMYTQPENVSDRLLRTIASHSNIAPYLDIPMQHSSSRILAEMNRKGSGPEFLEMIDRARGIIPDVAIRTTLIAGFPGETEDDFDELVEFVQDACFDYVGVFAYCQEEGTKAATMEGQIDTDEKEYRAERLRTVADAVSSSVIASRIGRSYPVIVEAAEEDGQLFGRSIVQAPEVDGVTYVDEGSIGSIIECKIADTLMYDMEADAS